MIPKTWLAVSFLAMAPWAAAQSPLPAPTPARPALVMTADSEMTTEGKQAPSPTPEHPIYYAADSAGYHQVGDAPPERTLSDADMAAQMTQALAVRNYRPADAAHPPTLLIVYTWGAHNPIEHANAAASPADMMAKEKNLLERAALVGGQKFAVSFYQALKQEDDRNKAQAKAGPAALPADNVLHALSPLDQFRNIDAAHATLVDQAFGGIYFVVATAYDYQHAAQKQPLLLWRTQLTASADRGVGQEAALPVLVQAGAPYFGQDMAEAACWQK